MSQRTQRAEEELRHAWDEDPLEAAVGTTVAMNAIAGERIGCLHDYLMSCAKDPYVVALAGRERMIQYGGSGTPNVPESAVTQIAARFGMDPYAAQTLVADTLSLAYRLPRVYAALREGAVAEWQARMVASATRALSLDATDRIEVAVSQARARGSRDCRG